ncbi:MAG: Asp23/Gls24 family envelope stress response protein [Monoglobales bacterium]|jgi:uncharacterized alkaline shock family protein YloU
MKVIAFVGPSGTGKSYRSVIVSKQYGADAMIDDGLLVSNGKVLAGSSAKRQPTKIASVKHALFMLNWQCEEVRQALAANNIKCLMILGTSDGMVEKIANNIGVGPIEQTIRIEDVASEKEIELAHKMRINEGKHVIPVPTFEIKQDFSGYFIHPLRHFQKNLDSSGDMIENEKSIVRPTFSYMGDYTISDNVIIDIASYEAMKIPGVSKVQNINLRKTKHGVHIDTTLIIKYGVNIYETCRKVQLAIRDNVEKYTSVNARRVHVLVRNLSRT